MLNQCVLVGRIKELDKETKVISIAIPRSYKNENGEYDSDLVPVLLTNGIADNVFEYCGNGDIVGVKARLENHDGKLTLIADKVSFLSSKSNSNDSEEEKE